MTAETCGCGHLFDPHILVPFDNDDVIGGGLMFCQELDTCPCVNTWSVPQVRPEVPEMPSAEVVETYRQALKRTREGEEDGTQDSRGVRP